MLKNVEGCKARKGDTADREGGILVEGNTVAVEGHNSEERAAARVGETEINQSVDEVEGHPRLEFPDALFRVEVQTKPVP